MSDKLEAYLEEISHFLAGKAERQEILSEIRSHIAEKAAEGPGEFTDAAIERAIAAFGPPRQVAERYLAESRPIIAPAYRRYLVRYTSILFALHAALTVFAVAFKEDLVVFPLLFIPKFGAIGALMYLPTAFLADLGIVALVLYFITQSGKDVRLPWPRFGVDLDEVLPPRKMFWSRLGTAVGAVLMLILTDLSLYLFARHGTIFLKGFGSGEPLPLLTPVAGRRISLVVIAMFAASAMSLFIKLLTRSRWVDIVNNIVSLALIGLLLGQPFDNLFAIELSEQGLRAVKYAIQFTLLFIALIVTIELIKGIVVVSRRRLSSAARSTIPFPGD